MKQSNLIPVNKDDQHTLDLLKQADGLQILAVASELLEWLADSNWPIAWPLSEVLCPHVNQMKPELIFILRGTDCEWKCCCIRMLIEHNEAVEYIDDELLTELRRLTSAPTKWDRWDFLQECTHEALARWDHP